MSFKRFMRTSLLGWACCFLGNAAHAGLCPGIPGSAPSDNTVTCIEFYFQVYLDGVAQPVPPNKVDISGQTSPCIKKSPGGTNKLKIKCSLYDDLYLSITPSDFGSGATVDHWNLGSVSFPDSQACFTYGDVDGNQNLSVYLNSGPPPPVITRDPVTARWSPEAAHRSGGSLTWGQSYLTAQTKVMDPTSDAYPALLYSREAFAKQVDLAVKGVGLDVIFGRVHRSGTPSSAGEYFGGQWTHNFDIFLTVPSTTGPDEDVNIVPGNGQRTLFRHKYHAGLIRYFYADGWDAELRHVFDSVGYPSPGHYELAFGDGVKWIFPNFTFSDHLGATLRPTSITDRFGNAISPQYDTEGLLTKVTDTTGRGFSVAYNGDKTIHTLTEDNAKGLGRVITYGYTGGRLSSVTYPLTTEHPAGSTIHYGYDGGGRLVSVTDGVGNPALVNHYDSSGKLSSQDFGAGLEAATVNYVYAGLTLLSGEDHGVAVYEGAGNIGEYYFNDRNQLLRFHRVNDGAGFTELTTWDDHVISGSTHVSDDLPVMRTSADGIVTAYTYQGPGTADTDYKFRMNLDAVRRTGSDGKAVYETFTHNPIVGGTDYWDARFGEQFVTCHALTDGHNILQGTAYTYSDDGKATLDGIDYLGIPVYGGEPFGCFASPGLAAESAGTTTGEGDSLIGGSGGEAMLGMTLSELAVGAEMYGEPGLDSFGLGTSGFGVMQELNVAEELYDGGASEMASSFSFPGGSEGESLISPDGPESTHCPDVHHHEEYCYYANGQLAAHTFPIHDPTATDLQGARRTDLFDYDANHYLHHHVVDSSGLALTTTYTADAVGRVTAIEDPKGDSTAYAYDNLDQVTTVTRPAVDGQSIQPVTSYHYDLNGNIILVREKWLDETGTVISVAGETDANDDLATEYHYDTRNRLIEVDRENGSGLTPAQYQYDGNGNLTVELSPLAVGALPTEPDNVTTYTYDERNLLSSVTRGNAETTRYEYDAGGRVVREIKGYGTPEALDVSYEYDGLGFIKSRLDGANLQTNYVCDVLGRIVSVEQKDDLKVLARTTYTYRLPGRLTAVEVLHRDATGLAVSTGLIKTGYSYTDAGMVRTVQLAQDTPTTYQYDAAFRLAQVDTPTGSTWNYTYDANGNYDVVTEHAYDTTTGTTTDFLTEYEVDERNRVTSVASENAAGGNARATTYAYDSLNHVVNVIDGENHATAYEYDSRGRLHTETHDPGLSHIAALLIYDYDDNDRLKTQTDPVGNITTYHYDQINRLIATDYADGQSESDVYDAVDNVIRHISPDGLMTEITRDGAGRPTLAHYSHLAGRATPGDVTFTYDALGGTLSASNANSTVTRTYDTLGNACSEQINYGGVTLDPVVKSYDHRGDLRTLSPHGGANALQYTHDADGKVTGVSRNGNAIASFDYLGSRPSGRAYANGATAVGATAIQYEDTGRRPYTITHDSAVTGTVDSRQYGWDNAYNLANSHITAGPLSAAPQNYSYDGLNRLDSTWTLNESGDRTSKGYTLIGNDEAMHRYTTADGLPCRYDPRGALVSVTVDAGAGTVQEYHYDAEDRLLEYRGVAVDVSPGTFNDVNVNDGDWTQLHGTWSVNDNGSGGDHADDYLQATAVDDLPSAILYKPAGMPQNGFTFRYRSSHAPEAPGYAPAYYAQGLLAVDDTDGKPYPYCGVRIEPDRLSVVALGYDGAWHELDSVAARTEANTWYEVKFRILMAGVTDFKVSVERDTVTAGGGASGDAAAVLMQGVSVAHVPDVATSAIGFTVGAAADYDFQLTRFAGDVDQVHEQVKFAYDAFGRKISETRGNTATLFAYEDWRVVEEVAYNLTTHAKRVVADYVLGPDYPDDIVAERRDVNGDGSINADESTYHLADQQYSTVALLSASGYVAERFDYDPFGVPSFHAPDGSLEHDLTGNTAELTTKPLFTANLFTGQRYLPEQKGYDARNRVYQPTTGRFLTQDPASDPGNLGNPYTYVGNNPGSAVDPFGLEKEVSYWEVAQQVPGELANSYLGRGVSAIITGIGWLGSEMIAPFNPAQDVTSISPSVKAEYTPENALSYVNPSGPRQDYRVPAAQINQTGKEVQSGLARSGSYAASAIAFGSMAGEEESIVSVYKAIKPETRTTEYVGITKNIAKRAAAHLREKGINIKSIPGLQNLSPADARSVEQVLIEYYGLGKNGGSLRNKINAIAKSNPKYSSALSRGIEILHGAGYEGF